MLVVEIYSREQIKLARFFIDIDTAKNYNLYITISYKESGNCEKIYAV